MEYVGIALAAAAFCLSITLLFRIGEEKKTRDLEAEQARDLVARISRVQVELERRLHCVEEDLEKIPVEEVNAEMQRLELFNDGIANIMGYGPDVPKLNREAVKK